MNMPTMPISAATAGNIGGDIGGAVGDLFAASGAKLKEQGDLAEQQQYTEAAGLAQQNVAFTQQSTAIKEFQTEREVQKSLGQTRADVAGAGFAESGSSLDILRESASQGALTKSVMGTQGLITEAGYQEQADSYRTMASAAGLAAQEEEKAAKGDTFAGIIKGVTAVASIAAAIPTGGASLALGAGGMGLAEGAATGSLY
jgi:hypothetical protein